MRNIVIIGGSSGIGLSLVKRLHDKHNIFSFSRHRGDLPVSDNIHWESFDVLNTLDASGLPERIDGLVYCPGTINLKPARGLKPGDVLNDFNINALGALKVIQSLYKKLHASDAASIVLFSTVAVTQGMPYHTSIAMAKGAVEGMTRSLAAELAPKIRVNAVAPSLTDTTLAERLLNTEERKAASAERHALKKIGQPEDIAAMVDFLLSEDAGWITGQVIGVDGGMGALKI